MVKTDRFDRLAVQKAQDYTLLSHCTFQGRVKDGKLYPGLKLYTVKLI